MGAFGIARGIVLISRSVPRRRWESRPLAVGAGDLVDWSRAEESQDCWTVEVLAVAVVSGFVVAAGGGAEVWGLG